MVNRFKIKKAVRRGKVLCLLVIKHIKEDGFVITFEKIVNALASKKQISYRKWMEKPLYTEKELEEQRHDLFNKKIKISVITPLYNTPETFLKEMIDSVIGQTYSNWELCLADGSDDNHDYVGDICRGYARKDSRIKYKKLEKNLGISGNSNICLEMATGDYIALFDHDDILHPAALHDVMKEICTKNADFIYTDEAVFYSPDISDVFAIHFKPDYSPDSLLGNNYICHLSVFRKSLLEKKGMFRAEYDGSQDHDLIIRLTNAAETVIHIPKVLYYWRSHQGSVADDLSAKLYAIDAGIKAIEDNLKEQGINASVRSADGYPTVYRIQYELNKPLSKVSIIIPNYNHKEDLSKCINSILEKSTYPNYEIVIVENNSNDDSIFTYYNEITRAYDNIKVVTWEGKGFNWSAINNYGVRAASSGDYILLLNNDIEVITPSWIEEMLMYAQRQDVGVVGAMLYYPDETIQHAGVLLGVNNRPAGHYYAGEKRGNLGYMFRLIYAQDVTAVTGACMMIRRDVFDKLEGIDEDFAVGYNDIDLCMRARAKGYLVVWTPHAELYHYESKSRGYNDTGKRKQNDDKEADLFKSRWAEELQRGDPYYNPNLSLLKKLFTPISEEEKEILKRN